MIVETPKKRNIRKSKLYKHQQKNINVKITNRHHLQKGSMNYSERFVSTLFNRSLQAQKGVDSTRPFIYIYVIDI